MPKKSKAHKIREQIYSLQVELMEYQSKCKHKRATFKYGANTGNYYPSSDVYWKTWRCPTCLKTWTECY